MLRTGFTSRPHDGHLDFSFNDLSSWVGMPIPAAFALIGDENRGPLITFTALPPGVSADGDDGQNGPAHGHASDNLRMPLRGTVQMGPWTFGPGEFRLQQGWKAYGSDTIAAGPEGGWELLMFADRRGVRVRPVRSKPDDPIPYMEVERMFSEWTGWKGDWFGDDPATACPPSTFATSLGSPQNGGITNDFGQSPNWLPAGGGSKVAVSLLGDSVCGPVVVVADTAPGLCADEAATYDTEVLRLVYSGSCTIGEQAYGHGDIRIDLALGAGENGLQEIVVFGDRRAVARHEASSGWGAALCDIMERLRGQSAPANA